MIEPPASTLRQRFEAIANALRDLLAQRWLLTSRSYDQENPKQVYYLSMEFLLGRSLTNNLTNLLVEPIVHDIIQREGLDLLQWRRRNLMLAWVTVVLGVSLRASSIRWRPCRFRRWAMGCAIITVSFASKSKRPPD